MSRLRLQILVLLDELKKVTAVAEEIGVKQPTISFHMKKLEEEWGVPLFEIKTGKVLLTEPGRMLLRYAAEIIKLYKEAEARFQSYREHGKNGFFIGSTDAASSLLFGQNWHAEAADVAHMRIQLITGHHDGLIEQLHAGAIDLLISGSFSGKGTAVPHFQYQELAEEPLLLFMGEKHPLAGNAVLPPYKLANHRFVELADKALQEALRGWEQHEKVTLASDWSTDRVDMALDAAAANGMLAVLPAAAAARASERVHYVPMPGYPVSVKLTAAWRSDYWNQSLMQRIVSLLGRIANPNIRMTTP